jgi:hypothetical protein
MASNGAPPEVTFQLRYGVALAHDAWVLTLMAAAGWSGVDDVVVGASVVLVVLALVDGVEELELVGVDVLGLELLGVELDEDAAELDELGATDDVGVASVSAVVAPATGPASRPRPATASPTPATTAPIFVTRSMSTSRLPEPRSYACDMSIPQRIALCVSK